MSSTDLQAYVGAGASDAAFVNDCWFEAEALVGQYVGVHVVPDDALKRACLEVGAELFNRRQAPGGITQFATVDGPAPVRLARDPMLGAYPILDRFLPGAFA